MSARRKKAAPAKKRSSRHRRARPKAKPARRSLQQRNKQLARDFVEAISRADVDAIVAAYAPDGTCWTSGTLPISGTFGVDQVAAASRGVLTVFPEGLRFTIHAITAEGDRVAIEAESHGLHASGKLYNNKYHFLLRARDGKIVEWREYMDTMHANDVLFGGGQDPILARLRLNAEQFKAGNSVPFFESVADDVVMRIPGALPWSGVHRGKTRFVEVFESIGRSGEFQAFELLDVFGSKGRYAAYFHEVFRVRETGKTVDQNFVALYRIERDQIVEYEEVADTDQIARAFAT
jgi:ketosteroid isomerase-like protein